MELIVTIDIGLHYRNFCRALRRCIGRIDAERNRYRHNRHNYGCYAIFATTLLEGFVEEDVGQQYPQRASEHARIFIPLHCPRRFGKPIAENEPGERNLAPGVPKFGCNPSRNKQRVGQCSGSLFRHRVVEHKGEHIERSRDHRGGNGTNRRSVPYPPNRSHVPQHECQQRPAEEPPPIAARIAVRVAKPQQRSKSRQRSEATKAQPPQRE